MFVAAVQLFFLGLALAVLVHPYVGLAVMGVGLCCLFWRVLAALALPFLGLGALWATLRDKQQAERLAAIRRH